MWKVSMEYLQNSAYSLDRPKDIRAETVIPTKTFVVVIMEPFSQGYNN